jgi:hypothetical protein
MTIKVTHNITISEPITLADLRELVEEAKDFPATSKVTVTAHKQYDQRDWDPATITVHGAKSR